MRVTQAITSVPRALRPSHTRAGTPLPSTTSWTTLLVPRYRIVWSCSDCPGRQVSFLGTTPAAGGSAAGFQGVPLEAGDRAQLLLFLVDHGPMHTIRVAVRER